MTDAHSVYVLAGLKVPPDSVQRKGQLLPVLIACAVGVALLSLLSAFLLFRNKYLKQRVEKLVSSVRTTTYTACPTS
jgi:hypothetical protein